MLRRLMASLGAILIFFPGICAALDSRDYFAIQVVDDQTGRGVPLVQLKTTNDITYYSDSSGWIALHEPGLVGQSVFIFVESDGYEFPKDGFGFRGKALQVTAGGSATLRIHRLNIAERLYRITGGDIYRDSLLLGKRAPTHAPLLNGQVFGSDSVENVVYRSKIHWFWGDTTRPAYPLGLFDVPGATSLLPGNGGLNPGEGIDLTYYLDEKGFSRAMAKMPGDGPTWIDGLVALKTQSGERMFAHYMKIHAPLTVYARGLAEFDDQAQRFRKVVDFPVKGPIVPSGHPFQLQEEGVEYVYFPKPFPLVRVRATEESLKDIAQYEAFTCLEAGSTVAEAKLDRTSGGKLRYSWKKNTPIVGQAEQKKFAGAGAMKAAEGLLQLRDHVTGKTVLAHNGSIYWNPYRGKWIAILCESAGTSFLGEIWYAEADTPLGPWVYAVKVLTHNRYSFYNPKQDPMFDQDGGRIIYFEGTYTNSFSGNPFKTPRYDYNQMMYRLDLADARLALPAPVYRTTDGALKRLATHKQITGRDENPVIAFFAPERAWPGTVPVFRQQDNPNVLQVGALPEDGKQAGRVPLFYALPANIANPPTATTPLFESNAKDGKTRLYSIENPRRNSASVVGGKPICLVWKDPYQAVDR